MNSIEDQNNGNTEVQLAASELVNAAAYYSSPKIPSEDQLREIRTLVERQLSDLVISIRREVVESMAVEPRTISPAQLAKQWGITIQKVLGWIQTGKLDAINIATKETTRPRYRIEPDAIAKFYDLASNHALLRCCTRGGEISPQ